MPKIRIALLKRKQYAVVAQTESKRTGKSPWSAVKSPDPVRENQRMPSKRRIAVGRSTPRTSILASSSHSMR